MQIQSQKLTQSQTYLLLAMFLADSPNEAESIAHRNARTMASLKMLNQLGMVVVGENGASVTETGITELVSNGYITEQGETTEFGQQFYQQAVGSLNEYKLINELMLRD